MRKIIHKQGPGKARGGGKVPLLEVQYFLCSTDGKPMCLGLFCSRLSYLLWSVSVFFGSLGHYTFSYEGWQARVISPITS